MSGSDVPSSSGTALVSDQVAVSQHPMVPVTSLPPPPPGQPPLGTPQLPIQGQQFLSQTSSSVQLSPEVTHPVLTDHYPVVSQLHAYSSLPPPLVPRAHPTATAPGKFVYGMPHIPDLPAAPATPQPRPTVSQSPPVSQAPAQQPYLSRPLTMPQTQTPQQYFQFPPPVQSQAQPQYQAPPQQQYQFPPQYHTPPQSQYQLPLYQAPPQYQFPQPAPGARLDMYALLYGVVTNQQQQYAHYQHQQQQQLDLQRQQTEILLAQQRVRTDPGVKQFKEMRPLTFYGNETPLEAEEWLRNTVIFSLLPRFLLQIGLL